MKIEVALVICIAAFAISTEWFYYAMSIQATQEELLRAMLQAHSSTPDFVPEPPQDRSQDRL